MGEELVETAGVPGRNRRGTSREARIQRFLYIPKDLFIFIFASTVKLLFVHALIDSYKMDMFFCVLMLEYFSLSIVYFMVPVLFRSRLLLLFLYVIQVIYTSITLSYYFVFVSNIHINIISKLYWEFFAVFGETLSWGTVAAVAISLIDIFFFYLVLKNFSAIRNTVTKSIKFATRQVIAGFLLFVLIVTTVNAYEFFETGNNTDRYKEIEDYSLHHYGMFASTYLEIYNYRNIKESIHKLNYSRKDNTRHISNNKSSANTSSVLLIQVESLDANIIGQKWHGRYIAPFLTRMAENNVYYPYTLSYRSAGGSSDTEMAILNNVQPLNDTPTSTISQYDFPNSIARVFRNNNYDVLGFHGNVGEFYNRNAAYAQMGFDRFFDQSRMRLESQGWGASDDKVFDFVSKYLKNRKNPFFSYIITMSSHEPFKNVYNYYNIDNFSDVTPEKLRDYFISISYVDKAVNRFVDNILEKHPNTYVYIFGDHAPYVLHGKSSYGVAMTDIDNYSLQFVPTIIITPDKRKFKDSTCAATFLDIAPTIILNSKIAYSYEIMGDNLLEPLNAVSIKYKGKMFDRKELYNAASKTRALNFGI